LVYCIFENYILWAWSEFSGYACKYNQGVLARPRDYMANPFAIIFIWKSKPQGSSHTKSGLGQGVLENWSIGMKAEDYDFFLFLYLALLHYSLAQT